MVDPIVHPGTPGALRPGSDWRSRVESVCRAWYGTPFRDKGQVKGVNGGVDCCTFIIGVAAELGLIPFFVPAYYSQSMPINEHGDRYMNTVKSYCRELAKGEVWLPGDVLFFHLPGAASSGHAAIYLGNQRVAHADWRDGVREDTLARTLFRRFSGAYRFKE